MVDERLEVVHAAGATLGEGTVWDDRKQVLWWTDIKEKRIYRHNPTTNQNDVFEIGDYVGTIGLCESDRLLLATEKGIYFYDPDTQTKEFVADPEAEITTNRMNDGKPGPCGGFFVGSMGYEMKTGDGNFYRLAPDGSVKRFLDDVTISNGMAWNSAENTFYYIDTPTMSIDAFDYDRATGSIENRRTVVKVSAELGRPDGMTIDADGKLWVAMFSGRAVHRWDPETGKLMESIRLPVSNITCCSFGGPDLSTLYMSTARVGVSDAILKKEPLAGGLFRIETDVMGAKAFRFRDQKKT